MDGPGEEESLSMLGPDISEMGKEDLLTPWEKLFMYSQLGYDMDDMDDYLGYDDYDVGFGDDEEDDFGDDEC